MSGRRSKPRNSGQQRKRVIPKLIRAMKRGDKVLLYPRDRRRKPVSLIVTGIA